MSEEYLALLGENLLSAAVLHGKHRVFERKPHHRGCVLDRDDRHKRRLRSRNVKSEIARYAVSVSGRSGARIRNPARSDDHRAVRVKRATRRHSRDLAALAFYRRNLKIHDPDPEGAHLPLKRIRNIRGAVGFGEHTPSALRLQRNAERFEKLHRIRRSKSVHRAVEEFRIFRHMAEKLITRAVVRDIAPALSRDPELFPREPVFLVYRDRHSRACRRYRGKRSGRSGADHGCRIISRHRHSPRAQRRKRGISPREFHAS